MSRPSSRAIYCKHSACPPLLSSPLGQAPQTLSSPPPLHLSKPNLVSAAPTLDSVPTVHRKEYSQNMASEPSLLQHRVEVSTPGPQAVSEQSYAFRRGLPYQNTGTPDPDATAQPDRTLCSQTQEARGLNTCQVQGSREQSRGEKSRSGWRWWEWILGP